MFEKGMQTIWIKQNKMESELGPTLAKYAEKMVRKTKRTNDANPKNVTIGTDDSGVPFRPNGGDRVV